MSTLAADFTEHYEMVEALSGNALFAAYRVRERPEGDLFLLKTPRAHLLENTASIAAFRELMARVQSAESPAMPRVHEIGGAGSQIWIVSEAVDAPTTHQTLPNGFPLERVLGAMARVADALDVTHKAGAYHGDLNPRNVLLSEDGAVQLIDTGMAALSQTIHSAMRISLQTPHPAYMAPEVLRGAAPSPQSDIYSLGMTLYELVTGHLPFPGNSAETVRVKQQEMRIIEPHLLNPDLPQEINALIAKAMSWEPNDRFSTAADMASALRTLYDGLSSEQGATVVPPALAREEIRSDRPQAPSRASFGLSSEMVDVKVCPECFTANAPDGMACSFCWHDLQPVAVVTREEGRGIAKKAQRRIRLKRFIRRGLIAAGVLALIALYFFDRTAPPGLLTGAPTSLATAAHGLNVWSSPRAGATSAGSILGAESVPQGTVQWQLDLDAGIASSPAVSDGRLFITTLDGRIIALDTSDGSTLWEITTIDDRPIHPMDASPTVADGKVYVGFRDSTLAALDAATGEKVWTYDLSNPIFAWVTVDQGIVYALSRDGVIQTLDAQTGELRWEIQTDDGFLAAPAVSQGKLVAPNLGRDVFVLDGKSGQTRLVYLTRNSMESSAAVPGNVAILGGVDGFIRAIDIHEQNLPLEKTVLHWWAQMFLFGMAPFPPAQSGTIWTKPVGEAIKTSPAVSGNRAIVTTQKGTLAAFRMSDGGEMWRTSLESEDARPGSPIIVNETIFVGTSFVARDGGNLHAYDVSNGSPLWSLPLDGAFIGSPAFANGILFLVTDTGVVYAID